MNATVHTAYTLYTHDAAQLRRDLEIVRMQAERHTAEKDTPATPRLAHVKAWLVGFLGHAALRPAH